MHPIKKVSSISTFIIQLLLCGIIFVMIGVGCSKRSWHRIPNGKLEKLLTELYTARGVGQTHYITSEQQDSLYASILQAYGVSQEDLDSTIYYLSASKAKVLQKVIAQSRASIQREIEILERGSGLFEASLDVETEKNYFYTSLSDSLSLSVIPLAPYPIRINKEYHSYQWQIALADIPHHPDTIRQVEIQGLISDTHRPSQYQMPYIAISKRLDGIPVPFGFESVSKQLPIGGLFKLSLGETLQEITSSTDTLSTSVSQNLTPHFLPSDTITISLYAHAHHYLSTRMLRFELQDLRIIAH